MRKRLFLAIAITLLISAIMPFPSEGAAQNVRFFPETGHAVGFGFLNYWSAHGGLPLFGFPLTDETQENGRTVQYFERARFEFFPEHQGSQYEVQLGLLGKLTPRAGQGFAPAEAFKSTGERWYFPETRHSLSFGFLSYWKNNGALSIFGFPISEEFSEVSPTDGKTYTVQYFERARFEYHPELPEPYKVSLGLLGYEYMRRVQGARAQFGATTTPSEMQPGQVYSAKVTVTNASNLTWTGEGSPNPVRLAYHWLRSDGSMHTLEGLRTNLPNDVPAGATVTLNARVQAPATAGQYTLQWDVIQEGIAWASERGSAPANIGVRVGQAVGVPAAPLPTGANPTLRVGVFSTTSNSITVSSNGSFTARDGAGNVLTTIGNGQTATVTYTPGAGYNLSASNGFATGLSSAVRFIPEGSTLLNVDDMPKYRTYRNIIEVAYSTNTERLWAVNELGLEEYLYGVAEEPEDTPMEALKAGTVAYRSYAYAKIAARQGEGLFDLASSTPYVAPYEGAHQWYIGYYRETIGGKLRAAVDATRGEFVLYQGAPVLTPYYSNADGRTRSWEEVWSGSRPWLVSVPDPDSVGMTLNGHGVGMPLYSAKKRAEAGWGYVQILTYFYSNTSVARLY